MDKTALKDVKHAKFKYPEKDGKKKSSMDYLNSYCKCITFGNEFFLVPLAVELLRQLKYTAKCAFTNQPPNQIHAK